MIGVGHVITFFVGAFIGRYFEVILDGLHRIRSDMQKFKEGKR